MHSCTKSASWQGFGGGCNYIRAMLVLNAWDSMKYCYILFLWLD
jgi:hypothetical protein